MAKDFKKAAMSFIPSATSELSEEDLSPSKDKDRKKSHDHEQESMVTRTMSSNEKKKRERKSRRVNLLMYPSLVDSLKAKAEEEDISLNELMCQVAEEFLKNNYIK